MEHNPRTAPGMVTSPDDYKPVDFLAMSAGAGPVEQQPSASLLEGNDPSLKGNHQGEQSMIAPRRVQEAQAAGNDEMQDTTN